MGIEVKPKHAEESIDKLIRRFKNKVKSSGILDDLKKHEFYEKPSLKKRKKLLAAKRINLK